MSVHPRAVSDWPNRLLERARPLTTLNEYLAAVNRTGRGRLVFIGGEAGVGKSALVRAFCAEHTRSVSILSGACDALRTPRPLGPILEVAQLIGGELAQVLARGSRPYDVAAALMLALKTASPTILVLEDLHWADEATLDVLRLLGRRIESVPALVLASYRDDELDRVHLLRVALGELGAAEGVVRLSLGRLSAAAVAELGRPFGVDARDLYGKTGGNPFFVTEVLAAGEVSIPPTVRDAVLARASRLPSAAFRLLEAVAVVPPQAEPWLLEGLAPDAADLLDDCLAAGMLTLEPAPRLHRHPPRT
jgi:predicted ATPase